MSLLFRDSTDFHRSFHHSMLRDFDRQFFGSNNSLFNDCFDVQPRLTTSTDQNVALHHQFSPPSLISHSPSFSSFLSHSPVSQCKVDIIEQTDKYLINAELSGIEKKDIKLDIHDNILTISGEHKNEVNEQTVDNNTKFIRKECSYGHFQRSMKVPKDVDQNKIQAKYKNGILNIILPKIQKKEKQYKNKIQIQ